MSNLGTIESMLRSLNLLVKRIEKDSLSTTIDSSERISINAKDIAMLRVEIARLTVLVMTNALYLKSDPTFNQSRFDKCYKMISDLPKIKKRTKM